MAGTRASSSPRFVRGLAGLAGSAACAAAAAPPALWTWQIATASASEASCGSGMSVSPRSNRTISPTWRFSARPYPTTACLISAGAYSTSG